jgi:predicted DsbA family dithiol-disulfide isomerase
MKKVTIEIFSDVLCIWAWCAQARIDQLKTDYGEQVVLKHRLIPIFAAARQRVETDWAKKGGYVAFNRHLHELAAGWDHVDLHSDVWLQNVPESSQVAHLYLKALQLLEARGDLLADPLEQFSGRSLFEEYTWRIRSAFFSQARNISSMSTLDAVADRLPIPIDRVHELIDTGAAHAALHQDAEARDSYLVPGSPTLVFNEGRQHLYGNIGYRIIEANIRELLHDRQYGEASWC